MNQDSGFFSHWVSHEVGPTQAAQTLVELQCEPRLENLRVSGNQLWGLGNQLRQRGHVCRSGAYSHTRTATLQA